MILAGGCVLVGGGGVLSIIENADHFLSRVSRFSPVPKTAAAYNAKAQFRPKICDATACNSQLLATRRAETF